ncbi:hypothetical protein SAMN05660337_2851 [Maridesulfovibrio ferrireducens]|uniref:Lipoprotein n=1 Tax=Maridesulfovibrio ferrireducens TaxID=246191 RepID=A0A1G9JL09_9BACT|nr:hypothetical protein [Maridesulfovibrio ferrireducens]SDL38310.1 hypothetical protein SAMN05660337_2851 [Maridesulfovibrio ferrireducens]
MNHKIKFSPIKTAFLIIILVLVCGCQSTNKLRNAQDAFNHAAQTDISISYGNNFSEEDRSQFLEKWLVGKKDSQGQYTAALNSLNSITEDELRTIKKNNLYGSVVTLKALTYWKLEDYKNAYATIDTANRSKEKIIQRDKHILKILPALIALDESKEDYLKITNREGNTEEIDSLYKKISNVLKKDRLDEINSVINSENISLELKLYALEVKLLFLCRKISVYKAYNLGASAQSEKTEAENTLKELSKTAKKVDKDNADTIIRKWTKKVSTA